jgi:hypothetical protein
MEKLPGGRPKGNPNLLSLLDGGLIGLVTKLINSFIGNLFNGVNTGTTPGGGIDLFPGLPNLVEILFGTKQTATNANANATTAINTANGAAQTVVNVQKEVIQKIAVFDIKSPTAGWIAINGTEWPSIPRALLLMQRKSGSTSLASSHSHTIPSSGTRTGSDGSHSHSVTTTLTDPEDTLALTQHRFAYIRIPVDTQLTGLNFYAKGTPTGVFARLYTMSATGDLTAVTPESSNLAGLLVAGKHTATPWNFDAILVEAGTWVAVGFRVTGTTVTLAGVEMFDPEPPAGFYPIKLGAYDTVTAGTALPESLTESGNLLWDDGFVPYVAVGNNIVVAQPKRYFADNGDRADTPALFPNIGDNWLVNGPLQSSGIYIRSNAFAWSGGDNGVNTALYRSPLTTDKAYSTIHLGVPASATATTAFSRFIMRSNSTCKSGIAFAFKVGSMELQIMTAYSTFATHLVLSRTWAVGDKIDMQVGTDANVNEVIVWHNDIEIFRTVMTQNSGPGYRYGGIGVSRTPFQSSPSILDWLMYDIPDVEPPSTP